MTSAVYVFTHIPSGKFYIGAIKDKSKFSKYATSSKYVSQLIVNAPDEWDREILLEFENISFLEVVEIEQNLIMNIVACEGWNRLFNKRYDFNLSRGYSPEAVKKAANAWRNPEIREKMSKSHLGLPSGMRGKSHSDSAKQKLREANLGKKASDETKAKMSKAIKASGKTANRLGKKLSEETILKMSKSIREALNKEETILKMSKSAKEAWKSRSREVSEETRIKMSKSRLGKVSPMKGKKLSELHKLKIKESLLTFFKRQENA